MKKLEKKSEKWQSLIDYSLGFAFLAGVASLFLFFVVDPFYFFNEKPVTVVNEPQKPTYDEWIKKGEEFFSKLSPEQKEMLTYEDLSIEAYQSMESSLDYPNTYDSENAKQRAKYLRIITKIDPQKLKVVLITKIRGVDSVETVTGEKILLAGLTQIDEIGVYGYGNNYSDGQKALLEVSGPNNTGYLYLKGGEMLNLKLTNSGIARQNETLDPKYKEIFDDPYGIKYFSDSSL